MAGILFILGREPRSTNKARYPEDLITDIDESLVALLALRDSICVYGVLMKSQNMSTQKPGPG